MNANEIQYIKGVGPKRAEILAEAGILAPDDLVTYFPASYIDRNARTTISNLFRELGSHDMIDVELTSSVGFRSISTIVAKIIKKSENSFGKKRKFLKLTLSDGSGTNASIFFWNYVQYYSKHYQEGQILAVSGKAEIDKYNSVNFSHPEIDILESDDARMYESGMILPKYRITEKMAKGGITNKMLSNIINQLLEANTIRLSESLPDTIRKTLNMPDIKSTVLNLHFPQSEDLLNRARWRIKFEEIFYFLMKVESIKHKSKTSENAYLIEGKSKLARQLYDSLPFELTSDQKKVLNEIAGDFRSGQAMNRLLQGDVGSGKTIVAALSILMAIDAGFQCGLMAPTEILAEQHYSNLSKVFEPLGLEIFRLMGGQTGKQRKYALEKIADGTAHLIIGTHAMFSENIMYKNLAYLVIDEQHRFGVKQRGDLINLSKNSSESKVMPHVLVMSATPIPRTLTMTVYGDLDVSIIKTMPKNRIPIKTYVSFDSKREEIYDFVRRNASDGGQAFIVFPLVEKSEKMEELKSATEHFEFLSKDIFPELQCGLVHGQMHWSEKEDAMQKFLAKEYDILVATTVIEVGIDIPNANIMLIENAERFGLSQLHQLRGRVGRGTRESYCILMTKDNYQYSMKRGTDSTDERITAIARLKTMVQTTDGFEIAETDMKLRGPGDIMGTKQSGLPEFKYLSLAEDGEIIAQAKKAIEYLLRDDPKLNKTQNLQVRAKLVKLLRGSDNYFEIA
ncbi:MAG: ATP-dependent DNA helicase RecG [Candidatus Kapabacteria bacterium]|nr:ATP-dependent DNA helicase RecG [Candidatus Kapabacteria bacterium]